MKSLRARLILWNTIVLALGLVLVGGTIAWLNLSRLEAGIDRELLDRSRFGTPGPPRPGAPFGGGQNGEVSPPPQIGGGGPLQGQPVGPPPGQRPRFQDPDAELIGSIRRPRIVGPDGLPPDLFPDTEPFDRSVFRRVREAGPVFTDAVFRGEPVRVYTAPAPRFGPGWLIQVARETRDYRELARVQWLTLLTVLPIAVILTALGGRFLTGRAMLPIGKMGDAAAEIGAGSFDRRIEVEGDDEFAQLGRRFNEMASSLGLSFAEQQAAYAQLEAAFEQQRRFVADASHELRTPLTRLQLTTSAALEDPAADAREALMKADASAQTMARLVSQLLDLAKADAGELHPLRTPLDLRALVADVVATIPANGGEVKLDLPEGPVIAEVDVDQVSRALINLIENARHYSPPSGAVTVVVREGSIAVHDGGEGIAAEHLPKVRERFYRVDTARQTGGAGLGLAIVDDIMRAHGGSLEIESQIGEGTKATLRF